jgi:hypothetical protein
VAGSVPAPSTRPLPEEPLEELEDALVAIADEHDAMADDREVLEIGLEKTDIRVAEARLVWVPVA